MRQKTQTDSVGVVAPPVDKSSGSHYSWLKTIPPSDINFKSHLQEADAETIRTVLKDLPEFFTSAKRKILEARLRRLEKDAAKADYDGEPTEANAREYARRLEKEADAARLARVAEAKEKEAEEPDVFSEDKVFNLYLENIIPSPFEPQERRRANFKKDALLRLASSIKIHKLKQPIVVRRIAPNKYEIVFGERRWLASRFAGLETIRCFVGEYTDDEVIELQYEENHRRTDPDPLGDAFYFSYLQTKKGYSDEELASRLNTPLKEVREKLKLNDLIEAAKKELSDGSLPLKHAYYLAKFPAATQTEIVRLQLAYKYHSREEKAVSFETFRESVEYEIVRRLTDAPFPTDDPRLHVRGLLCRDCPDNSAFATYLFPEFAGDARCLDKACFEVKDKTSLRLQREAIAEQKPNPTNIPIEEIASEVPLVTDRKWLEEERVPFKEKVLTDQELLDAPECEFSEISLAVDGAKKGQPVWICREKDCPTHRPKPILEDAELSEMETDFDERVAARVRLKIFRQAMQFFDDRKTLWMYDDLIKNLIVEILALLVQVNTGYASDILYLLRDWENAPKNLRDKDRLRIFADGLDKARQSQLLFLLSIVGTEDLEVLKIAKGYTEINFILLDAETRLELAPDEFKPQAREYLEAMRRGQICDVPRFWRKGDFDGVGLVSGEEN